MAKTGDILLNFDGSILIQDGDIVFGDATENNQLCLLNTSKGEWKQNPLVGISIEDYLLSKDVYNMLREIKGQMQDDGMNDVVVKLDNNNLTMKGTYE